MTRVSLFATAGGETARFPDLTFEYSDFDPSLWQVSPLRSEIALPGENQPAAQWVDLTGNGLPDMLLASGRMLLWRNRGDGWFDGPSAIPEVPATVALDRENVAFADLNGDGRVDLFAVDQPLQLAYTSDGHGGFRQDPVIFRDRPTLRLSAPDTRLTDLNGDGVTDLLQTGRSAFLLFLHVPELGWQEPLAVERVADLAVFPDVTFIDRGVSLGDMTGDGLDDMVFLRSGQALYWPSLGNGQYAKQVEMENPPQFPVGYREDRVVVADVDGDGCADVVYMDVDRTLIWLNRSGTGFSAPFEIPAVPAPQARVRMLDVFGDGRPALVWGVPSSVEQDAGYRALRLDSANTPYLLKTVRNGMGRLVTLQYSNTAAMRRADRESGADWPGILPFIVSVVTLIRDEDEITGVKSHMTIRYHDAVYDGPRREFRGFGRVTVDLDGDESIPAARQEHVFFQGDPENPDLVERDRQRALSGTRQLLRSFALDQNPPALQFEAAQTWEVAIDPAANGASVFLPRLVAVENREVGVADPDRIDRTEYSDFDAHGNPRLCVHEWFAADAPAKKLGLQDRFTFIEDETNWLVKLLVRREQRDIAGTPVAVEIHTYDGPAFEGLPEGSAVRGLPTRSQALALRVDALPADYVSGVDFTTLGYTLQGSGDLRGFYVTSFSIQRDVWGNITGRKDPLGGLSTTALDADGVYPVESMDVLGRKTTVTFDVRASAPIRLAPPDTQTLRWIFDPLGRMTARFETGDDGTEQLVAAWFVDVASSPNSITSFKPRSPGRLPGEFGPSADLAALTDVSISRSFLDGTGNSALTVTTAPDGPGGTRRLVAAGRVRRNPRGLTAIEYVPEAAPDFAYHPAPAVPGPSATRHRYDTRGNLIETAGPDPVHYRMSRDTFSMRQFEGDAAGPFGAPALPAAATRVERFDARNRVVRIEEAADAATVIATGYDLTSDSRLEVLRDGTNNEVTRYTFAGPGEAIRIAHRDAGTRSYYRDARGLIVRMIVADGTALHYSYDASGRLVRIESQDSPAAAPVLLRAYTYDADPANPAQPFVSGRLAVVREPDFTLRFAYDRAGRQTVQTLEAAGATLTTQKFYDLRGDLTAVVYPDGRRVGFTRDSSGSVTSIPGIVISVAYDDQGRRTGYAFANGVDVALSLDPVSQRLAEISASSAAGPIRNLNYAYDAVGNITSVGDTFGGATLSSLYTYDGLHRISGYEIRNGGPAGAVIRSGAYQFDPGGNLRRMQETADLTMTYGDALRPARLTAIAEGAIARPVTYDSLGRTASFEDLARIEYDALDRVSVLTKADGTVIRLRDDHLGHPVLREIAQGGATSRTIFAGDLYEVHGDHTVRNIYLDSIRLARETLPAAAPGSVAISFFLTDHHGTAILETGAAGAIISMQQYSPFGQTLVAAAELDRYLDRELDPATGLVHFGARMYVPRIGRFLSPDWYVLENPSKPMRMPQGYNVYSYAMNNPLIFEDRGGRWFFLPFIVGFVVGLVYGIADGRDADGAWSLAKETALTTGLGFNLGWMTGMFVGGPALAGFAGAMGGVNGLFAGTRQIYDDIQFGGSLEGIASLVSDSTWGLLGTTLANAMNIYNLIAAPSSYRSDLSKGQNRQVYDRGFCFDRGFAFTQGNTISNLSKGKPQGGDPGQLLHHESTHIFQSRMFGPLYQLSYAAWLVYGGAVGLILSPFVKEDAGDAIRDVGYYDNPWEAWAYEHGGGESKKRKLAY